MEKLKAEERWELDQFAAAEAKGVPRLPEHPSASAQSIVARQLPCAQNVSALPR